MNTKAAAGYWNVRASTVANYCKNGDIPCAYKDHSGKWSLPLESIKPFPKEDIKKVLRLTLQLQNNPNYDIDYLSLGISPEQLPAVYDYLFKLNYIKQIKNILPARLPYEVTLTDRGIGLVTSDSNASHNSADNIGSMIDKWGPLIINLATAIIKAS
ncbi:MAG: hypothetical protein LBH71_02015 [Oscillospiraceae bacterium]|jgi:hypothetical protein|nr:hypothetical protein [Oscillospiraceae bacterium]